MTFAHKSNLDFVPYKTGWLAVNSIKWKQWRPVRANRRYRIVRRRQSQQSIAVICVLAQ